MPRRHITYQRITLNPAQRFERTWKLAGQMQTVTINGQYVINQVELDRKTLYTNPYLIVTEAEYTKHYYIEGQRVASNLGGGWDVAGYDPLQDHLPVDQQGLNQLLVERFEILEACSGQQADFVYLQDRFESILDQLTANDPEDVQYFYHSDHLGSSSFITDASGTVDQHLQYLPFGEPWIDQRTNTGIRFTFSGKEKDEETGYSYFGARYYNSDISIWLSVDPLSDEYPSLSPYNYCANNPIMLVDPDGRHIETTEEAYSQINQGLKAILADKNPFYRNNENGHVKYNSFSREDFTPEQLELVDMMVSLIDDDRTTSISTAGPSDPLPFGTFNAPNNGEGPLAGATSVDGSFVWLCNNPQQNGKVENPEWYPNAPQTIQPMIDGFVNANLKTQPLGINALHELGHVYFNWNRPELSREERNNATTDFETRMRSIYQIGIRNNGQPRYLGGTGLKH
jgi:RHS repeat-associated protein